MTSAPGGTPSHMTRSSSSFRSLRAKITLGFLIVGLGPQILIGVIAYRKAADMSREESGNRLGDLAFDAADKLDRMLFERYRDIQGGGQAGGTTARSMDPGRITDLMNRSIQHYSPMYSLMVVANIQGHIIAANTVDGQGRPQDLKRLIGMNVKQQSWFRASVSGQVGEGHAHLEDFREDLLLSELGRHGLAGYAASLSAPIRDPANGNNIVGVWSNRFNWEMASNLIHEVGRRARRLDGDVGQGSTEVYLLNSDGVVLVAPQQEKVGKRLDSEPFMKRAVLPRAAGSELTASFDGHEHPFIVGYFRSRGHLSFPGAGWIVVATRSMDRVLGDARTLGWATFYSGIGVALAIIVVAYFLARTLTVPLIQIAGSLHQLTTADADLSQRLPPGHHDEVGEVSNHFNLFMDKLDKLIKQVLRSGIQVTTSTTHIQAGAKQLEATVAEQVAATNEVVATARQISATSHDLARTMGETNQVANENGESARSGQADLERMERVMGGMEEASRLVSAKLSAINDKAGNISTVVTTITKVADQTNLLSLNAAIEAEKAGQYGQGFAVVAREIRRLADQTAVATLDIEKMVKDMKGAVSAGVMSMENFTEQVRQAVGSVKQVSLQLIRIIDGVQAVRTRFETVNEGMGTQATAAGQISEAMAQLGQTTQQTAEGLRDINHAIEQLNEAARGLQGTFSRFHVSS
jgi:methyl-accepting chemotaxis protein